MSSRKLAERSGRLLLPAVRSCLQILPLLSDLLGQSLDGPPPQLPPLAGSARQAVCSRLVDGGITKPKVSLYVG